MFSVHASSHLTDSSDFGAHPWSKNRLNLEAQLISTLTQDPGSVHHRRVVERGRVKSFSMTGTICVYKDIPDIISSINISPGMNKKDNINTIPDWKLWKYNHIMNFLVWELCSTNRFVSKKLGFNANNLQQQYVNEGNQQLMSSLNIAQKYYS